MGSSSFVLGRWARHIALVACAASGAFVDRVSAQTVYRVNCSTCAGCNICLDLNEAGPDPVRSAEMCSSAAGCFASDPYPIRFGDLASHRGLLQIVSDSTDVTGCPQTLISTARWDANNSPVSADVFFTGPSGATHVFTRVRYRVSTASSGGAASFRFSARFQNHWANDLPVPANVTDFELVSPLTEIGLDYWRTCEAQIQSSVITGTTCYALHFPLNEPVFDLPPGYTANSPALGIVDNIWHGLDVESDWSATVDDMACFSWMPLLHSVAGELAVEGTSRSSIDLGALADVTDGVRITDNTSADDIDLGTLSSAGGSVVVTGNGTGSSFARSLLPLVIDCASLQNVDGDLDISGNSPDTTVAVGPLATVNGDLTLETRVSGNLDLSAAEVSGSIDIEAQGADSVAVATPGATADIEIARDRSSIAANVPAGAFVPGQALTIAHLEVGSWAAAAGLDEAGAAVRLALLAVYSIEVAGDPALQQDATLALELNVEALPAALQSAVLRGLMDDRVVLARRDDAPQGRYRTLATCPSSTPPVVDGCVALELLDANRDPLPPGSLDAVSFVRFTALTADLSDYAIAVQVPRVLRRANLSR